MMTNQQAALIAAASQVQAVVPTDLARKEAKVETLKLAREYVTWLDQQDEIQVKVGKVI